MDKFPETVTGYETFGHMIHELYVQQKEKWIHILKKKMDT